MGEEGLKLGEQELSESQILYTDLDDLYTMYKNTVLNVSGTRFLHGVHPQITAILHRARDHAVDELGEYGVDVPEPDIEYAPAMKGAHYEEGTMRVGEPGRCDRPYYLVTELSHEMLHEYLRDELGVTEYTAREEGLMQVWNLHQDDVIGYDTTDRLTTNQDAFDESEVQERLDDMRTVYNESQEMPDGFGDDIYQYTRWFLGLYEEFDGTRKEKMQHTLDFGFDVLGED